MNWPHVVPPKADLIVNAIREPEGERLRAELEAWLAKNKIVSMLVSTENHEIAVSIGKLPDRIKTVLTHYGSIYVVDEKPADKE